VCPTSCFPLRTPNSLFLSVFCSIAELTYIWVHQYWTCVEHYHCTWVTDISSTNHTIHCIFTCGVHMLLSIASPTQLVTLPHLSYWSFLHMHIDAGGLVCLDKLKSYYITCNLFLEDIYFFFETGNVYLLIPLAWTHCIHYMKLNLK
jgi:hypothetical protein